MKTERIVKAMLNITLQMIFLYSEGGEMKTYRNIQMFLDYVPNNYQKFDRWSIISKRDFDAPIYMENVAN